MEGMKRIWERRGMEEYRSEERRRGIRREEHAGRSERKRRGV
jgi:hypothetical protein